MVADLERFRDHFAAYGDRYVLIGGAACEILLNQAGLSFRVTKDLDIVLCIEALEDSFVQAFWNFVHEGDYRQYRNAAGRPIYYRFDKPGHPGYPHMLELFSRRPDVLGPPKGVSHLTPIPAEDCSSLSAILMDDAYYAFIQDGKIVQEGITLLDAEHLIPLKARAWLDLSARRQEGQPVDSKSILKHRNDVARLFQLLEPTANLEVPRLIAGDMARFLQAMSAETLNLKDLGIHGLDWTTFLEQLNRVYFGEH